MFVWFRSVRVSWSFGFEAICVSQSSMADWVSEPSDDLGALPRAREREEKEEVTEDSSCCFSFSEEREEVVVEVSWGLEAAEPMVARVRGYNADDDG